MASVNPPKRGVAYTFYVGLVSQSNTKTFQSNPTIATGDVKVSKDGAGASNITTLPTAISGSKLVAVPLSASEMTADTVVVLFSDAAGAEWCDLVVGIHTVTSNQFDDLATAASISALNDLSAAQVNAEVDTAISDAALATAASVAALNDTSAADVWGYATRTLTQAAASVTSAVTGSTITVYRGTTWSITLTGLADNSNYDEVYFSVKRNVNQADTAAYLRVSLGTGLERFNGAAATAGDATLTLPSSTSVTITVDESVTDDAPLMTGLIYDVKGVDNDGNVDILSIGGTFNVEGDVTRAIT